MTRLFDHPYASFLEQVTKPNRYTGAEYGVKTKPWDSVEARICLAFPDVYDIGMSHLGYRILYELLNDDPRVLAERCYTPYTDMLEKLEEHELPLASLESVRALSEFDVVGFSLQFELTYTNILLMLERGGIPRRTDERGEDDPLVIAGGPVATHAEPMAPFFDAILVGDGEEAAKEIALSWTDGRKQGKTRRQRLEDLAQLCGVYVPSLYVTEVDPETGFSVVARPTEAGHHGLLPPFPVERRLVPDLSAYPFPDAFPVGGPEAIFDRMSIEVARGCTEGCRFCQAGMIYRPVRERDPVEVINTVLRALEKSGQDEVSLTALSTADVSCIQPLVKRLVEKTAPERVSLSVASLRAYGLSDELLDDMRKVRTAGLTFAPEAGTQRMRDVINKNVTEEVMLETAERTFARGFDRMKLYFIIGLPTEEDEDVLGIAEVGGKVLRAGRRVAKRSQVTISASVHIPKPHTPFQWCAMDNVDEVRRKQRLLRDAVRAKRGLALKLHDSTTSELEGVLARGDRRLADVIERAYLSGARFDSWSDHFNAGAWEEAFEHHGIETAPFLSTLPTSARLPWDHIDVGLEDGFLEREYQKALRNRLSPPCGKPKGMSGHHTNTQDAEADQKKLICYNCGIACDLTRMREQRLLFLNELGATEPGQRAALPVLQEEPAAALAPNVAADAATAADAKGDVMQGDATADADAQGDAAQNAAAQDAAATKDESAPLRGAAAAEAAAAFEAASDAAKETAAKKAAAKKKASADRKAPERYRPPQPGSPPERYRLRYTKRGPSALLGHLDFIRELPRIVRRAGVRTAYTLGFHPKPDMSFGPALALGIASVDEYIDLKLIDAPEPDEFVERLNRVTAGGIEFLGAVRLGDNDPGLAKVIDEARYVLAFPTSVLGADPEATLRQWLEDFEQRAAAGEAAVERNMKGIKRRIDVGAGANLTWGGPEAHEELKRAGVVGEVLAVAVSVPLSAQGAVRSREIAECLSGSKETPFLAVRTALRAKGAGLLELEAFRRPPKTQKKPASETEAESQAGLEAEAQAGTEAESQSAAEVETQTNTPTAES